METGPHHVTPHHTGPHHTTGAEILSRVQPWGVPIQGGTFALLVSAIFMAKGALESAQEASESATQAVNDLRSDVTGLRTDVSQVQRGQTDAEVLSRRVRILETMQADRARQIDRELEAMRRCVRTRRKRDCEDI